MTNLSKEVQVFEDAGIFCHIPERNYKIRLRRSSCITPDLKFIQYQGYFVEVFHQD